MGRIQASVSLSMQTSAPAPLAALRLHLMELVLVSVHTPRDTLPPNMFNNLLDITLPFSRASETLPSPRYPIYGHDNGNYSIYDRDVIHI